MPALACVAEAGAIPFDQSKPKGTSGNANWPKFRAGPSLGVLGLRSLMPAPPALRTLAVSEALLPNPQTAQSSGPAAVRSMSWFTGCESVAESEPTRVDARQLENSDVSTVAVSVVVAVRNAVPGPVGKENEN